MRQFFHQIHLWLSIPLGILISVICLTGAILVFEKEITQMMYPETQTTQAEGQHGKKQRPEFFRQVRALHRWMLDAPAQKGEPSAGKTVVGITTVAMIVPPASILHERMAEVLVRQPRRAGLLQHVAPPHHGVDGPHLVVSRLPGFHVRPLRRSANRKPSPVLLFPAYGDVGRAADANPLFPRLPDRGNITAERLLSVVEETEAEIIRSGTEKAKASDDTNPGGSGSSEALFNRNPGGLSGFGPSKPPDSENPGRMILDGCHLKKIFAD